MARSWLAWLTPWWWPVVELPETPPDSKARTPQGRQGNPPDGAVDGFLGVGWPLWGRLAVASWLALFAAAWIGELRAWESDMVTGLWLPIVCLGGVAGANGVPGAAALLNPGLRERLLSLPEATALAALTLSAGVGLGGFAAADLLAGGSAGYVGAGIVIGIVSFPLSFGLAFPLGIPLVCSCIAWAVINSYGRISRTAFVLLTAVSAVGWAGVVLIGMALGVGA